MKLDSAKLYYGTAAYPIKLSDELQEVEFEALSGDILELVCLEIAHHTGLFTRGNGADWVMSQVTYNLALEEKLIEIPGRDPLVIPRSVQFIGNGFSVIWKD